MKYRKKPITVDAITFDEFIEYGKTHECLAVDGMPWSFEYNGHKVTYENDTCYLIPTLEGVMKFTPNDVLITGIKGEIYPCKIDIFEKTYEPDYETFKVQKEMTEQEQIDELAKYICNACEIGNGFDGECSSLMGCDYKTCFITIETAKHIYEAGYRKQSDVAEEIFEEIEQLFTDVKDGCEVYHTMEPEHYCELKKKYTEEQ